MRMDYRLDPPEPAECPECGDGYWPEDGGCQCGYSTPTLEDVADDLNDRAADRAYELQAYYEEVRRG